MKTLIFRLYISLLLLSIGMNVEAGLCLTEIGYDKNFLLVEVYNFSDTVVSVSKWKLKAGNQIVEMKGDMTSGSVSLSRFRVDMISADSLFLYDSCGKIVDGLSLTQLKQCGRGETLQREIIVTAGADSVMRKESPFVSKKATYYVVDNLIWENRNVVIFNRTDNGRMFVSAYLTRNLSSEDTTFVVKNEFAGAEEKLKRTYFVEASPNPVDDILTIRSTMDEVCIVRIMNINGTMVYNGTFRYNMELNMSSFEKGVYLLIVTCGNRVQEIKIEKK